MHEHATFRGPPTDKLVAEEVRPQPNPGRRVHSAPGRVQRQSVSMSGDEPLQLRSLHNLDEQNPTDLSQATTSFCFSL